MLVYILDSNFRNTIAFESYTSFIWTERFNTHGDFEMVVSGAGILPISLGTLLGIDGSRYVMQVETIERDYDQEGKVTQTFKGRSLEVVLLGSRVSMESLAALGSEPTKWVVDSVLPTVAIQTLYEHLLVDDALATEDLIPELESQWDVTGPEPSGDIAWPDIPYSFELDGDSMYAIIKLICETFNLGFRILKNDGKLHFSLYTGFDRTTGQVTNSPVVFSQALENLISSTELESVANLKNVAYVYAKNGFAVVPGNGFDSTVSGFERKVLRVIADDLDLSAGPALTSAMQRRGLEALGQYRTFSGFDGEISNSSSYIYGRDYYLGDLVEIQNDRGWSSYVRVTEQIFTCDETGIRQYPTLTTEISIKPGTWLGWPPSEEWVDVEEYWSDV